MDKSLENLLTGKENTNLVELEGHLIDDQTAEAFIELKTNLKNINSDIELSIYSGHRSFTKQLAIWNEKASFNPDRPIRHMDGKVVEKPQMLLPHEIVQLIMRWSAIPGASRHHWGTDIDIYDKNALEKNGLTIKDMDLIPSEYEGENAIFSELNQALNQLMEMDKSAGFFRPYAQDFGAISPEPWHISFAPVAEKLTKKYTQKLFASVVRDPRIMYFSELKKRYKVLHKHYVKLEKTQFPGFR